MFYKETNHDVLRIYLLIDINKNNVVKELKICSKLREKKNKCFVIINLWIIDIRVRGLYKYQKSIFLFLIFIYFCLLFRFRPLIYSHILLLLICKFVFKTYVNTFKKKKKIIIYNEINS